MRATRPRGDANTWKVGLTWDTPHPGIRSARLAVPRHSRAEPVGTVPAAGRRLTAASTTTSRGRSEPATSSVQRGQPALKPERSQTTEVGIVWQPDFIPGLPGVDRLLPHRRGQGAISPLGLQNIEDLCFSNGRSRQLSAVPGRDHHGQRRQPESQPIRGATAASPVPAMTCRSSLQGRSTPRAW